jgi:hypothetical protein
MELSTFLIMNNMSKDKFSVEETKFPHMWTAKLSRKQASDTHF